MTYLLTSCLTGVDSLFFTGVFYLSYLTGVWDFFEIGVVGAFFIGVSYFLAGVTGFYLIGVASLLTGVLDFLTYFWGFSWTTYFYSIF